MIDAVGLIAASVAILALWWKRRKRAWRPHLVSDPPRVDPANKVRAERLLGPYERMRAAMTKGRK